MIGVAYSTSTPFVSLLVFFLFFSLLATLPLLPLAFCLVCLRFVCATNKQKIANVFWPFRQGLKSEKKEQEDVSFFWRGWSHWYCFYWCLMLPANQHARRWTSEKVNKVVARGLITLFPLFKPYVIQWMNRWVAFARMDALFIFVCFLAIWWPMVKTSR